MKILGTFALIDEGETDWKILVIDVKDPLADKINGKLSFIILSVYTRLPRCVLLKRAFECNTILYIRTVCLSKVPRLNIDSSMEVLKMIIAFFHLVALKLFLIILYIEVILLITSEASKRSFPFQSW